MAGNVAINGDEEFEGGRLLVATRGRVWAASRKVRLGCAWRAGVESACDG